MTNKLESSGRGEGREESSKKHRHGTCKSPEAGGIPDRGGHEKVSEAGWRVEMRVGENEAGASGRDHTFQTLVSHRKRVFISTRTLRSC